MIVLAPIEFRKRYLLIFNLYPEAATWFNQTLKIRLNQDTGYCSLILHAMLPVFIIILRYKKPVSSIEAHLREHNEFLQKHYAAGKFICSGPQQPRTGGVIMAYNCDREQVNAIIAQDPFYINDLADYEVISFAATKYIEEAKFLASDRA